MKHNLILAVALGFTGCISQQDDLTSQNSEPQAGQIQLVQGTSAHSISSSSDNSSTYVFNLDTAKNSIEEEFILQNTGDYDVTNIKLTTNNPHFYFTPSELPILPCSKNSLIMQVIKLKVIHGERLDGIGTDSLLPMGANAATATITARTSNTHHDSLNITQTAQLKVFAKVMDIGVFDDSISIDLFHSAGYMGSANFPVSVPVYVTGSGKAKVVNTGNVNIMLRVRDGHSGAFLDSALLKPREIFLQTVQKGNTATRVLELDAQGVVGAPNKFSRSEDARAFLMFMTSFP